MHAKLLKAIEGNKLKIIMILNQTAARIIQKTARQKFLIYFRQDVYEEYCDKLERIRIKREEIAIRKKQADDEWKEKAKKRTVFSQVLKLPKLYSRKFQKPI